MVAIGTGSRARRICDVHRHAYRSTPTHSAMAHRFRNTVVLLVVHLLADSCHQIVQFNYCGRVNRMLPYVSGKVPTLTQVANRDVAI